MISVERDNTSTRSVGARTRSSAGSIGPQTTMASECMVAVAVTIFGPSAIPAIGAELILDETCQDSGC